MIAEPQPTDRRTAAFVGLLLVLATATPAFGQERRPMTTDDVLDMVDVDDAVMSPDGAWVVFSKSELDWDENERKTTWWRVPADGSAEPHRFIGEEGGANPSFSPDGSRLAFTREVDDERQLFVMRTDGGEALQLTEHATAVGSYEWTADGSAIVFVADDSLPDDEESAREKGFDAIFVDEGPNGQRRAEWNDLWRIELETEEETRLTEAEHRIGSFDLSPDASRIAFTVRTENRRNQQYMSEIHLLDVASGEVRSLTDNRAPEGRLTWSPDGRHLAYEAPSDDAWELRLDKIWVMDVETGDTRMVSGAYEGSIRGFVWTPDGSAILFSGLQGTDNNLYRLQVSSGDVLQLTDAVGSLSPSSFSTDRARMAYVFQDWDTPPDVWAGPADGGEGTRLTDANPWIAEEIALAESRLLRWKSSDGLDIEGILTLPVDADEAGAPADGERSSANGGGAAAAQDGPYPLLLHIHGGPAGVFTNSFDARRHVWAGLGYAQLSPNVRGSSGYTDELLRGNMRDIGGGDYQDLMTGVDAVIDAGIGDPERLALRGWSYGGILGGWTITQTDRFEAASVGAMVADWTSEYGPGFNHDVSLWYIGGTPWDNPEEWRYRSALTHVANVTTPTIIFHGMNDRTDTEPQSMMFFQALKDQDKTVRYLRFPREGHGIREPRHQRTRDIEEIRWIQKHAQGIDWEPWERPAKDGTKKEVVS